MRRLPAEWEPQSAVMLTWPHAATDWADQLDLVEALYARLAALISHFEPVLVVCRDDALQERVRKRLADAETDPGRVLFALADSNDSWARDHGPVTVLERESPKLVDFRFNGWGGKFPAARDDAITATLAGGGWFGRTQLTDSSLVVEGGAIESNGGGTLMAVSRTLVDEHRNPGRGREQIEAELSRLLGSSRFLWLNHGQLSGDDTDGHIDTLARFCAPDTICFVRCEDASDPDYPELAAMARELAAFRMPDGRPYRLVPLPHPSPVRDPEGRRLPAGYANFLIINGAVLVPTYADPADQAAVARLQGLFPGRAVLPVDCRLLIRQGGSLHCITMQFPAQLRFASQPLDEAAS
jgi:agmatine/peptidylarginine deiminase